MSAFIGTGLDLTLRTLEVDTVVVAGIQTPNCIRTTVFDAMAYNYNTWLLTDATAAKNDEIHQSNVMDMENIGVRIIVITSYSIHYTKLYDHEKGGLYLFRSNAVPSNFRKENSKNPF